MQYNFDEIINRRESGSLKWDVKESELPMWVADMDFKTAPEIIDAIKTRVEHGIFGYNIVTDEWYEAICGWWSARHDIQMEKESLVFCTGVVPAISSIVRKMTTVGENVLVQTPVYNIFFNSIVNNGRHILESQLIYDGSEYQIDYQDLEEKLSDPQTTMMLLCNPHNPIGKIWDRETLSKIGELCKKYHVLVVSDEIHCELTDPGHSYLPFASVSKTCAMNSITCIAPTKAFNIAGLQTAAVMIPNEQLRHKVERGLNTDEVAEPNSFAITATVAAFTKGAGWLDALRDYIFENKRVVAEFIENELSDIKLVPSEATYLLWLDCKKISRYSDHLTAYIRENSGLRLSSGSSYGESGEGFLRMNIACPREYLLNGLKRLKKSLDEYEEWSVDQC
ncbi:aspartate aminotransferase [Lachnospiraceae bacterium KM106-2]|nr:aspartate aminotransferase [Lachnospiraceae bacterium KM106-2]